MPFVEPFLRRIVIKYFLVILSVLILSSNFSVFAKEKGNEKDKPSIDENEDNIRDSIDKCWEGSDPSAPRHEAQFIEISEEPDSLFSAENNSLSTGLYATTTSCQKDANGKLTVNSGEQCNFSVFSFWPGYQLCPTDNVFSSIEVKANGTLNVAGCTFIVNGDVTTTGGIINFTGGASMTGSIVTLYYTNITIGNNLIITMGSSSAPAELHMGVTNIYFKSNTSKIQLSAPMVTNEVKVMANHTLFGQGNINLQYTSPATYWTGFVGSTDYLYLTLDLQNIKFVRAVNAVNLMNCHVDINVNNMVLDNSTGIQLTNVTKNNAATTAYNINNVTIYNHDYNLLTYQPRSLFYLSQSNYAALNDLDNINISNVTESFYNQAPYTEWGIYSKYYNKTITLTNIQFFSSANRPNAYNSNTWRPTLHVEAYPANSPTIQFTNFRIVQPTFTNLDNTSYGDPSEVFIKNYQTVNINGIDIETFKSHALHYKYTDWSATRIAATLNFTGSTSPYNRLYRKDRFSDTPTLYVHGNIADAAIGNLNIQSYIWDLGVSSSDASVTTEFSWNPTLTFQNNYLWPAPCDNPSYPGPTLQSGFTYNNIFAETITNNTFGCNSGAGRGFMNSILETN